MQTILEEAKELALANAETSYLKDPGLYEKVVKSLDTRKMRTKLINMKNVQKAEENKPLPALQDNGLKDEYNDGEEFLVEDNVDEGDEFAVVKPESSVKEEKKMSETQAKILQHKENAKSVSYFFIAQSKKVPRCPDDKIGLLITHDEFMFHKMNFNRERNM